MENKWWLLIIGTFIAGGFLVSLNNAGNQPVAQVGTDVGNIAPDFSYTTIDGEQFNSSDLLGKVVVLTSSAAWCNTCEIEAKEFAGVYSELKNNDLVFLTIDIDARNSIQAINEFSKKTNTPWDYVNATGGKDVIEKLELNRFEITYIIDKNGAIYYKDKKITPAAELSNAILSAINQN